MTPETIPLLLRANLKQLKLPAMLAEHDKLAREAAGRDEPYETYLLRLTEVEVSARAANALASRIRAAGFPVFKDFDTFDFTATARLGALGQAIDAAKAAGRQDFEVVEDRSRVAWEGLTLRAANGGRPLVNSLSAIIQHGMRLLVTGSNVVAQTALFRAAAGLWPSGAGRIIRPPLDELLFLPQRPYLPPGTLRELLTGPSRKSVMSDDEVLTLLHDRGLGPILHRAGGLDAERDWLSELSLEEQQLLALTRLSLAGPGFAFLDRPGSTVGSHKLDQALKQLSASSISYVMLGGAIEADGVFDAVLGIQEDGHWDWKPASH